MVDPNQCLDWIELNMFIGGGHWQSRSSIDIP